MIEVRVVADYTCGTRPSRDSCRIEETGVDSPSICLFWKFQVMFEFTNRNSQIDKPACMILLVSIRLRGARLTSKKACPHFMRSLEVLPPGDSGTKGGILSVVGLSC